MMKNERYFKMLSQSVLLGRSTETKIIQGLSLSHHIHLINWSHDINTMSSHSNLTHFLGNKVYAGSGARLRPKTNKYQRIQKLLHLKQQARITLQTPSLEENQS